jgi:hypothetical protein
MVLPPLDGVLVAPYTKLNCRADVNEVLSTLNLKWGNFPSTAGYVSVAEYPNVAGYVSFVGYPSVAEYLSVT